MFFPGETVILNFIIPFNVADLQEVIISYKQNEAIILEKVFHNGFIYLDKENTQIIHEMTQEESLMFSDDQDFTMQINVYGVEGTRHTSRIIKSSNGVQYVRSKLPQGGESS